MKPFYTQDVLVEATREELLMIRIALSCWMLKHEDWKQMTEEDVTYFSKMQKLYNEATKILDALPF